MNPTTLFWLQLFGRLAAAAALLAGVAALAARGGKFAAWPRAVWQACLAGMLLLAGCELTGAGRGLWHWAAAREPARAERKVIVRPGLPDVNLAAAMPASAAGESERHPAAAARERKPVWWPGLIWLAGFAVLVVRGGAARVLFLFRWKRRRPLADAALIARVRTIAQRLGVRRVRLAEAEELTGPIAFGLLRPAVCLPKNFATDFTPAQQEAMLAHELAHVAARDPAWYAAADLICALWWWHPLAWRAPAREPASPPVARE